MFRRKKKPDIKELERRVKEARQEAVEVAIKAGNLTELADDMLDRIANRTRVKCKDD